MKIVLKQKFQQLYEFIDRFLFFLAGKTFKKKKQKHKFRWKSFSLFGIHIVFNESFVANLLTLFNGIKWIYDWMMK